MANASEKQLKCFLKANKEVAIYFKLRPQGDNTIIDSKGARNMAEVEIPSINQIFIQKPKVFMFGGIREKYYDKLYTKYCQSIEGVKFSSGAVQII